MNFKIRDLLISEYLPNDKHKIHRENVLNCSPKIRLPCGLDLRVLQDTLADGIYGLYG